MSLLFQAAILLASQDPASLVERLGDDSRSIRDEAMRALREMSDAALPALRLAVDDPDPERRTCARLLITKIEGDAAMDPALLARYPGLRLAFETGDHERVVEIALGRRFGIAGYRGDFEAYGIKLLEHSDESLRKAGFRLLGSSRGIPRRPIAALVREMTRWDPVKSKDSESAWLADLASLVYRLGSRLDRDLLAECRASHPEAEAMMGVLRARHGVPGAEDALPGLVESSFRRVSWLALECVRDLRCRAARPQVLRRLLDPKNEWCVAEVIVTIEDDVCRRAYAELWRSTPADKRMDWHVTLFARSGDPEAVPVLLDLVGKGPEHLSWCAAQGLAALRVREAIERLLSPAVPAARRRDFIRFAAEIVDVRDVAKLVELLGDADEQIRNDVRWLLLTRSDAAMRKRLVQLLCGEKRPPIRERLLEIIASFLEDKKLVESVPDAVLESMVRGAHLDSIRRASELLLQRKGAAAATIVEESVLKHGESLASLLQPLSAYPSARVAQAAANWMGKPAATASVLAYLEKAGTPEARAALEDAAATLTEFWAKHQAESAVARLRGKPPPKSPMEGWIDIDSGSRYIDPVTLDAPGARDEIRKKFKESPWNYVLAFRNWAHPEMIPQLKEGLARWDEGLADRVAREGQHGSCLVSGREVYGSDFIAALAATGDRSLTPFFVERLADPDEGVRRVAIRTCGRWRLKEAVPILRRLVRSGEHEVRSAALDALARIGAPGTKEFILRHLRDNPIGGPFALARLGATDASPEIARLLEDAGPHAPLLGALDLLSHPQVYAGVDGPLSRLRPGEGRSPSALIETFLKVSARSSLPQMPVFENRGDGTLRGELEVLTGLRDSYFFSPESKPTFLFLDGAIEFCAVEKARAIWRDRYRR